MRRVFLLVPTLLLPFALLFAGTADAATAKTYTVTRTVGPYNGAAQEGDPGFPQTNGEADVVNCRQGDTAVKGSTKINRKTSHGTAARTVLRIGKRGVTYNEESGYSQFYAFITPTGQKGWNSVTLTVTCRRN